MMEKVLVIDNHDSFVYNLIQILRESENCLFDVMTNDKIKFISLHRYNKILLSPGPGIPQEAGGMMDLIKCCWKTHSILGVCLGHQALGEYFGAKIKNMQSPQHGHKSELQITDGGDVLYQNIHSPMEVGRYHSWILDKKDFPECLHITALDEDGNIMSFRHNNLPIYGVQYHPESIITTQGRQIIDNWLKS